MSSSMVILFKTLNSLLALCSKTGVKVADLPKIVVVGSQSAGKSSVVEAVVRHSFLPCGGGMVTKCPLVLHLKQDSSKEYDWAKFEHCENVEFKDFQAVRQEIEKQTKILTGGGPAVSEKYINLTIHSPTIVDLLLVDLPGKIAVDNDQGKTKKLIDDMVEKYMKDKSNIMLTVSDGSADVATSAILARAKEIDPEMNLKSSTGDTLKALENDDVKSGAYLVHSHVALMCRNAKEEKPNTLEEEADFFDSHKEFKDVRGSCGIEVLCHKLQKILLHRLNELLPKLKSQIAFQISENDAELLKYGDENEKAKDPMQRFYEILRHFSDLYSGFINGVGSLNNLFYSSSSSSCSSSSFSSQTSSYSSSQPSLSSSSLSSSSSFPQQRVGGAKVRVLLSREFSSHMSDLKCRIPLSDDELSVASDNLKGMNDSPFPEKSLLIELCQEQIMQMSAPCEIAVEKIYGECCTMAKDALKAVPCIFCLPRLKTCVEVVAMEMLESLKQMMMIQVRTILDSQRFFATYNVSNASPDQSKLSKTPQSLYVADASVSSLSPEERIRRTVEELFNTAREAMNLTVPQLVMYCLVQRSMDAFKTELGYKIQQKYSSEFKGLLEEASDIGVRRAHCLELKKELAIARRDIWNFSLPPS